MASERLKSHNKRVAFEAARKELATARTAEQNISLDGERNDNMAATSAKDVETAKKTAECVWVVDHLAHSTGCVCVVPANRGTGRSFKATPDASLRPQGGGEDEWRRFVRYGNWLVSYWALAQLAQTKHKLA